MEVALKIKHMIINEKNNPSMIFRPMPQNGSYEKIKSITCILKL